MTDYERWEREHYQQMVAFAIKQRQAYHRNEPMEITPGMLDQLKWDIKKLEEKYPDLYDPECELNKVASDLQD